MDAISAFSSGALPIRRITGSRPATTRIILTSVNFYELYSLVVQRYAMCSEYGAHVVVH
jgi:hypothetical protein